MKSIKELEDKGMLKCGDYWKALKDVLKLIDEIDKTINPKFQLEELKSKIQG